MIDVTVGEDLSRTKIKKLIGKKKEESKIDPTLNWEIAEVIEINENSLILNSKNLKSIEIKKSNLSWAIKNAKIEDVFELGDFVFVKKKKIIVGFLNNTPK